LWYVNGQAVYIQDVKIVECCEHSRGMGLRINIEVQCKEELVQCRIYL
jgi:hypothetical protein